MTKADALELLIVSAISAGVSVFSAGHGLGILLGWSMIGGVAMALRWCVR